MKMKKITKVSCLLIVILILFTGCNSTNVANSADHSSGIMKVHFIDVGQGDSILIELDNRYMLIDAGENEKGDFVANYLRNQGVKKLDYMIGTHPHSDHIGGLDNIIRDFQIEKVIMPNAISTTKTFDDVLNEISEKGLKITKPKVGNKYSIGDAQFIILAPNNTEYSDLNNYSVVIKLIYGETSFLLTGDAEELSENEMMENGYDLSADVLKLGHHGSEYSTSEQFLNLVNPTYAIISVGTENKYGHPSMKTIDKIKEKDRNIYRTDEMGTIVANTDGKIITFSYEKNTTKKTETNLLPNLKQPSSQKKENTVYVTETGSKYHRDGCKFLENSKIAISLEKAKKEYEPCSKCNPPQ